MKRRQGYRWAKAHLRTMLGTYWYITNKPFTMPNCTGSRAFKSIPFVALEDPPKNPMHQSFIGEKGKALTHGVYVERIPGNLTGTFITGFSDALNEVSGFWQSLLSAYFETVVTWPTSRIHWMNSETVSHTLCTNVKSSQKGLSHVISPSPSKWEPTSWWSSSGTETIL